MSKVARVISGTIKGKALTGSILGGVTVIDIINSGQTLVNNVRSFGSTTDGTTFLIEESGIGSVADNFARLVRDFFKIKRSDFPEDELMGVYRSLALAAARPISPMSFSSRRRRWPQTEEA